MLRELSAAGSAAAPPGMAAIRCSDVSVHDLGAVRSWVEAIGGYVDLLPRLHPEAVPHFLIPAAALNV
jgi:hypothetical protein